MKNKKTAVEWLYEEMDRGDWDSLPKSMKSEIFEQAKEMEQEQLAKAEAKGADKAVESLWRMMNDRD
jgi:hypothetical protein